MIKLRVLKDGFMIGNRKHNKGDIIQVLPPSVNYAVSNGSCELVKAEVPKPKVVKKKSTYKTKVVKAED